MTPYTGLNETDYNILIFAVNKLDIKGSEAATIVMLLDKLEKEREFLKIKQETSQQPQPPQSQPQFVTNEDGDLMMEEK
jgi:hypothetical protein